MLLNMMCCVDDDELDWVEIQDDWIELLNEIGNVV